MSLKVYLFYCLFIFFTSGNIGWSNEIAFFPPVSFVSLTAVDYYS